MSIYKQEGGKTYNLAGRGDLDLELYRLQKEKASTKHAKAYNPDSTAKWFKVAEIDGSNISSQYQYIVSFNEVNTKFGSGIAYIDIRFLQGTGINSSGTFFKWITMSDLWDNRDFAITVDNSDLDNPKASIWIRLINASQSFYMKLLSYNGSSNSEQDTVYESLVTYVSSSSQTSLPIGQDIVYSRPYEDIKLDMSLANRNNVYRGKNLTGIYTWDDISTRVNNGSFDDLYIGDYINVTIDSKNIAFRFAGFDTYLKTGDTQLTAHHIVVVPDIIKSAQMNSTNVTTGGFKGSAMWTTVIPEYNTKIKNAIGSSHVLSYRQLITNTVNSSGQSSNWEWINAELSLMSEINVYGCTVFGSSGYDVGIDNRQFPLFRLNPSMYNNERSWWWLKSVRSATHFCYVNSTGTSGTNGASVSTGFRPFLLIH